MKKIVGEILNNKNIDENLKEYYGRFMEINNKYAAIRLAMNYYTYYTIASEDEILECEVKTDLDLINKIIQKLSCQEISDNDIIKLEELRDAVINRVEDLTCYVDRFNIYEHALNRVEYRFKEKDYPKDSKDEEMTRRLMQYILAEEENMEINRRICVVIAQLPIHITKNKFYDMVSQGLSIYKGGTKESFKDFLYMIRTSAMLEITDTMQDNYPYLEETFAEFKDVKFKTISSREYEELSNGLKKVSEYIEEQMDSNMMIEEIINDLLIMLYTFTRKKEDNVHKACEEIIKDTNLLFLGKISPKTIEEIEDMFSMLEGEQEKLYPKLSAYDITDKIKENYSEEIENLGLTEEYEKIYKLPNLNSDSIFAELNRTEDNTVVDETYLESEKAKLFNEYAGLFADNDRMINRAVMAVTLSELPVFFNNISELQDFIFDTLSACSDSAEKTACIEILNDIMCF